MIENKIIALFPAYRDFHFFKDPGQIPFGFRKIGYNSYIVSYKNEDKYSITQKHLDLKLIRNSLISRKFNIGIILYLIRQAKQIDILNLFHIKWESLLFAFIYKIFNRKGFVYLKLDNCHYIGTYPWEKIFDPQKEPVNFLYQPKPSINWKIKCFLMKKYFVKNINLWSVEDKCSHDYFSKEYPFFKNNLIVSYNGHTIDLYNHIKIKSFDEKENIFFSAGRFGTYQKATEILLEAFALSAKDHSWELHLAGSVDKDFKPYIEKYFKKYHDIKNRIVFHGCLDKNELFKLYNRSKIFCLPSRYEGFAIVFSEAMYFKNAIITTPYVSPRNIIKDKMGLLVEKDDVDGLADAIQYLIDDPEKTMVFGENAHMFAVEELNWDVIVNNLHNEIKIRQGLLIRYKGSLT